VRLEVKIPAYTEEGRTIQTRAYVANLDVENDRIVSVSDPDLAWLVGKTTKFLHGWILKKKNAEIIEVKT